MTRRAQLRVAVTGSVPAVSIAASNDEKPLQVSATCSKSTATGRQELVKGEGTNFLPARCAFPEALKVEGGFPSLLMNRMAG